jgi:hypothetical protein
MVLVDYIGIFYTCANTFGHIRVVCYFLHVLIVYFIYKYHALTLWFHLSDAIFTFEEKHFQY